MEIFLFFKQKGKKDMSEQVYRGNTYRNKAAKVIKCELVGACPEDVIVGPQGNTLHPIIEAVQPPKDQMA